MHKLHPGIAAFCILLCNTFAAQTAFAEEGAAMKSAQDSFVTLEVMDPDGFVLQMPTVDPLILVARVNELRSGLILRKIELIKQVEEARMDTGDVIITVILPGGLLYAGYRKLEFEQAKNNLATVSADINELSSDLSVFQTGTGPVAVVRLH
jgi:hypothetical protein